MDLFIGYHGLDSLPHSPVRLFRQSCVVNESLRID